jgi:hypothetical protein
MRIKAAIATLACLVALLVPERADADKVTRKTRDRKFPSGWCPLVSEDVMAFTFKATGSSATIRFVADNRPGQRIDDIYVVERSVFQANPVTDADCENGSTFDPLSGEALFVETFDSEANGWKLNGSAWGPGSAPTSAGGALLLNPNGLGGVIVSGLKKGRTYVVGGWWYTEDENTEGAVLTLKVDTKGQLGCGPDGAVTGNLDLFSSDED